MVPQMIQRAAGWSVLWVTLSLTSELESVGKPRYRRLVTDSRKDLCQNQVGLGKALVAVAVQRAVAAILLWSSTETGLALASAEEKVNIKCTSVRSDSGLSFVQALFSENKVMFQLNVCLPCNPPFPLMQPQVLLNRGRSAAEAHACVILLTF